MTATTSPTKAAPALTQDLRARLARSPEAGALVGFIAVFIFFSLAASDYFLTPASMASIFTSRAVPGIIAVGVAFLMISGEFDLSVGSMLAVCALTFLALIMHNVPAILAAILGVIAGAVMGLVNGLILVWTRIPSFIVTLGTLQAYRAIALTAISGGAILRYADYSDKPPTIYVHPVVIVVAMLAVIATLGLGLPVVAGYVRQFRKGTDLDKASAAIRFVIVVGLALVLLFVALAIIITQLRNMTDLVAVNLFDLLNGRLQADWLTGPLKFLTEENFRTCLIWWALIVFIFTVILSQTRYGNATFATGGNPGAALAQGIAVDRVRVINFVISGALTGLAGVIETSRAQSVFPNTGGGLELEVIAACVIGGTLLSGGFGSIIGATIGNIITGVLFTGLVVMKIGGESVSADLFRGIIGVILIVTVVINTAVRRIR